MAIDFIALDLETANSFRGSICEIGLAFVEGGEVIDSKSWLVKPKGNQYDPFNIYIHGITPEMTAKSPSFPEVWQEVLSFINHKNVVAHNTSFDMYAIKDALEEFSLPFPEFSYFCSLRISRKAFPGLYSYSLPNICEAINVNFDLHHRAESDAIGCANVFIRSLEALKVSSLEELPDLLNLRKGSFDGQSHIPQRQKDNGGSYVNLLKNIVVDGSKFEPDNYFYEKGVCFTGAFSFAVRKELLQAVAEVGAKPMNSVTKETNILVVGQQDYKRVGVEGMSSKQKKAISLIDKGQDLEIMSESEFLSMFGNKF